MLATLIGSLYEVLASFHFIPTDAVTSFVDGDDFDVPIVLD
jgi:hypothetical protein